MRIPLQNKNPYLLGAVLFFIFGFLSGCSGNSQIPVEKQGFYMGTVITAKVYGRQAEKAAVQGLERIRELDGQLTVGAPGSEIQRLNASAGSGAYVPLSTDTMRILKAALEYGQLSRGCFDITVGPLVQAWGGFKPDAVVPAPAAIDAMLPLVNYNQLEISTGGDAARLKLPGQLVDLGGIAKGYAGDEVVGIFKDHGIKSAFVNLGGNVVVLGEKPDGIPWQVGIRNPGSEDGGSIGVLQVKDVAVVTSGDYERYFEQNGMRYHHLLDPQTGYPAQSGLISVTIVARSSMAADALSTAVFVMGLVEGLELVQSLPGVEAVLITEDGQIHVTPGLVDNFTLTDREGKYRYHEKK